MKWNFLSKLQLSPEPLTRGLPPPDPRSLCPLSSTRFVEPPLRTKFLGTPLLETVNTMFQHASGLHWYFSTPSRIQTRGSWVRCVIKRSCITAKFEILILYRKHHTKFHNQYSMVPMSLPIKKPTQLLSLYNLMHRITNLQVPPMAWCSYQVSSKSIKGVKGFYSKTKPDAQYLKFILFWNNTLHVSDGLSVLRQGSKTVHTASGMSYRFCGCLLAVCTVLDPW
jgi:hypothetical protein